MPWYKDHKWAVMGAVALGTFMGPLNSSVTNLALPYITDYFQSDINTVSWVMMSYLLVSSSLMLTYGRVGDLYGHRIVYLWGFIIFTVASVLSGLAGSIIQLIVYRGLQAVGAGMMMATVAAILTATFPAKERGKALGLNSMIVGLGLAAGPVLGGILVAAFGWRAVFLVNLPIGLVGILWAWKVLPVTTRRNPQRFDSAGAFTLFIALASLLLALSKGKEWGWSTGTIRGLFGLFVVAFIVFILIELKRESPMVDLNLFRNRLFSAANTSTLLNYIAQYSLVFLLPFYLERVRHLPPEQMGLLLTSFPVFYLLAAPFAGTLSDRFGSRPLTSIGMALTAGGLWGLSLLQADTALLQIGWRLALVGIGTGVFQSPNNSAIMSCVPPQRLGLASSMLASTRNIGMVLGVAISSTIFTNRVPGYLHQARAAGMPGSETVAFVGGLHDAYLVAALAAAVGIITSLIRGHRQVELHDGQSQPG